MLKILYNQSKEIMKRKRQRRKKQQIILYSIIGVLVLITMLAIAYRQNLAMYAQLLANPNARLVYIPAGLRKEQIASRFAKTLNWDQQEVQEFLNTRTDVAREYNLREGFYQPQQYLVMADSSGEDVANIMSEAFNYNVVQKYFNPQTQKGTVKDLATVLKIASIIEREAGKNDKKIISGILWNRYLKYGMKLQADATVQYAKGNEQNGWWPRVTGADVRGIQSSYNTYKIIGLPPSPISNPSLASIEAALNPAKTNCLFYIHDKYGRFFCSADYKTHERNIRAYLR
jgi:UPF0755 protein